MGFALVALTVGVLALLVASFAAGRVSAANEIQRKVDERAGMTRNSARLLSRAIKLLRRLDATTDLDGMYAGDVLSPETKKQVSEWLADYRKGLDRL